MKVGDKIKFDFAGKKKEGTVSRLFDNTVYLKVDFEKDKQKTVKRKISQVDSGKSKKKYFSVYKTSLSQVKAVFAF